MPGEMWNVFDFFVLIETRINFSSEFLFSDDHRLELRQDQLSDVESQVHSGGHRPNEHSSSGQLLGLEPGAPDLCARRSYSARNKHPVLFNNFLLPECSERDNFTFNLHNYRLTANRRVELRHIKSAHSADIRCRQKLAPKSAAAPHMPEEAWRQTASEVDGRPGQWRAADPSGRALSQTENCHYTRGQLVVLWLNLLVLLIFILRQAVNSGRGTHQRARNSDQQTQSSTISSLSSPFDWQQYLSEVVCSDLFASFTNRRMVNMVAVGSLVPSAVLRLISVKRCLRLHLIGWARGWMGARKASWPASRVATIYGDGGTIGERNMGRERLNIVQTDLCYLKSLYTSSAEWYKMLTSSWFHRHKFGNFLEERARLTKFCRGADKGGHQTSIVACDLITKMYFYNLINFDSCYVKYFHHNECESSSERETMCNRELRVAIGSSTKSEAADEAGAGGESTARSNCCGGRKKWPAAGGGKKRDVFVAKPLHRMDLNEMGWLLAALALLYGLGALTLAAEAFFSFLVETNLTSFSDISTSRFLTELRLFLTTSALTRWLLINLLDIIIILTTFDLYQFFACCLICLSRARYLVFRLEQISECCQVTSRLLEQEQRLLEQVSTRLNGNKIKEELAAIARRGQRPRSSSARQRRGTSEQGVSHISPASIAAVRELNNELKFMMHLIVIVQQELTDLKKFFSLYLNLELTFKSLCMTFSICALFDSTNIFESCYLLILFNTCTTPICITMITAALIENEFKNVCKNLDRIIITGGSIMSVSNLRQVIQLASFLSSKANRSFVVVGNFSLSLRSLVPILAWIATGVVMIRRDAA